MSVADLAPMHDVGGPRQPLLEVRALRKHFDAVGGLFRRRAGAVHAVDGVSFTIGKGEVLGIVGESGCGKSTTARLIIGLIEPDAGEIIFDGEKLGSPLSLPVPRVEEVGDVVGEWWEGVAPGALRTVEVE